MNKRVLPAPSGRPEKLRKAPACLDCFRPRGCGGWGVSGEVGRGVQGWPRSGRAAVTAPRRTQSAMPRPGVGVGGVCGGVRGGGGSSLTPPSAHPPGWTGPSLSWKCLRLHPLSSRTVSSDPERSLSQLLALTRSLLEGEQPRAPDPRTWRPDGWTGPPAWTWHVFAPAWGLACTWGAYPLVPTPDPSVSQLSKPRPSHANHCSAIPPPVSWNP